MQMATWFGQQPMRPDVCSLAVRLCPCVLSLNEYIEHSIYDAIRSIHTTYVYIYHSIEMYPCVCVCVAVCYSGTRTHTIVYIIHTSTQITVNDILFGFCERFPLLPSRQAGRQPNQLSVACAHNYIDFEWFTLCRPVVVVRRVRHRANCTDTHCLLLLTHYDVRANGRVSNTAI